jgi:beta-galactosidase/beta-glucuronidase
MTLAGSLALSLLGTQASDGRRPSPRPEHPKPQFQRDAWLNLNGQWNFAFDFDLAGIEKGWSNKPSALDQKIIVPFCPESKLSGIEFTELIPAVWYHRTFSLPKDWKGRRIFLHFGGVDYDCRAWINGQLVGRHYGGGSSFSFEITDALLKGENDLVVSALDDVRSGIQPLGKQSIHLKPSGITYTRVTGIWQTVWLEARPQRFIESARIVPDLDGSRFTITPVINNYRRGVSFQATLLSDEGNEVAVARSSSASGVPITLDINRPKPWSPADPYLYKLRFELFENDRAVDTVNSYAGLRKIHIEGNRIFLNNEPVFLRFVLDQGYYPEGVWTAPTDDHLKEDIVLSMAIGFNGARLHQKVFEERFHYWADRLGYLTWGEFHDWGLGGVHESNKPVSPQGVHNHQREWREVVMRDLNHPSIISWTPFNETGGGAREDLERHRRALLETVNLTKALDPTRPVIDSSGHIHVETDIESVHDYEQDVEGFREHYHALDPSQPDTVWHSEADITAAYRGQPYIVGEYGGTFWADDYPQNEPVDKPSLGQWGYGKDINVFLNHLESLTTILTDNPNIAGFCYTQLYDVEGELNGLYTYDRELKFSGDRLKKIFQAPAAMDP